MTQMDQQLIDDGELVLTPGLRAQTQPRRGWTRRLREASAERAVVPGCPAERALPYVWDIKNVERCERRADRVSVTPETASAGRYVIRGRIFGVMPWEGQFRYVLHEARFHSEDTVPRRGGLRGNGGFTVEAHGCRIWRYERYLAPWVAAPLKPAVAAYVRWTQRREMRDLAALIGPYGAPRGPGRRDLPAPGVSQRG
jgi:hypothetical protein